jgi:hypothetical protein
MSTPQQPATLLIAPTQHASTQEATQRAPVTVLAGLWAMGIFGLYSGVQQQFLPRFFYDQFLRMGHSTNT